MTFNVKRFATNTGLFQDILHVWIITKTQTWRFDQFKFFDMKSEAKANLFVRCIIL